MRNTLLLLIGFVLLESCSDKNDLSFLNGQFSGSFYYISPVKPGLEKVSAPALISFSGDHYSSQGNSDRVPAGGSGTFEVQKNNFLDFNDNHVWTADFDWNLILNGRYTYEIKGDSLILTRYFEPCPSCSMLATLYQYKMKRIN